MNWDSTTWLQIFQGVGPILGLLLFFIWRDWRREDLMSQKIEKLENYQRDTLVALVEETKTILAQNTEQLRFTSELLNGIIKGKFRES